MSLNWLGSLSLTSVGRGSLPAAAASSPKVAFLPDLCATTPSLTVISEAGTFQRLAAAWTNIARAYAPAWRSWSHEFAIEVEPPVPCTLPFGPKAELPYGGTFAGELSARIWLQEASSSSATTAGSPVQTPCPASTCLQITVTVLSGSIRTNGVE